MAKKAKRRQPAQTQHSAIRRDLRTPKYRMRVVEDKRRYKRQRDKPVKLEGWSKAA